MQQLLTKDWVGIDALEHQFDEVIALENTHCALADALHNKERDVNGVSIRDQLFSAVTKCKDTLERAKQQLNTKSQEIKQLENRQVSYPPHIEAAISAIHQQCPEAKPAVLCDYIEVIDSKWQMAIEGYLGGARFSIIVEPEYEAEAIRIVRRMKGNRNSARIIQGAKAQRDASKTSLPQGSIFDVMEFEHKIAEYYVKASYGLVVRVQDEEQLKKTARGITAEGLGSGNYSMFRCDVSDAHLVFGQGARDRALLAKQNEYERLLSQGHDVEESYHRVERIQALANQIQPIQCSSIINGLLTQYRQLQMAETQLGNLDLEDFEALENQLTVLKTQYTEVDTQVKSLSEQRGGFVSKIKTFEISINKLTKEQEALQSEQEQREQSVVDAGKHYPNFDEDKALSDADARAASAGTDFDFTHENIECIARMDKTDRQLYETIMQYNQTSNAHNNLVYFTGNAEKNDAQHFKHIASISQQISGIHNSLKNNVLVGKHEKLAALKDSFNTAFVTNLCHSIFQSINDGKRILEDLNKELEQHVFGSDQERFSFGWEWVPEFQEYWKFFKEVIDIPNLGDGSTLFDAEISEKSCLVRDKLLGMLLDKDTQYALRELQRISDYRHYRRYEIYKEPLNKARIALSKYGTGSGGQLETPAYIIRAAAITSAFRFADGSSHCRMVLVDEAFSKMDETRSREVINYLTSSLGLQLIFIMPTSKSGPFMDLISNQVIFTKCPTTEKVGELNTRVLVDRKQCNQDKIRELWARHRKTIRQQAMLDFMEDIV